MKRYHHLTSEQRYYLSVGLQAGTNLREIARNLNVSPSTLGRELARNCVSGLYDAEAADRKSRKRRSCCRKPHVLTGTLLERVIDGLKRHSSPEQISGRLKLCGIFVSHTAIYRMIAEDRRNGGNLWKLRRRRKRYRRRNVRERRGSIPDRTMITERPPEIDERRRFGDWEGDTVLGEQAGMALVTLTERMTGYEIAFKVKSRKAETVAAGIVRNLKGSRLPVLSITFDNGHEFSHHKTVSSRLGCPVYFSLPHHPWERGTNENTNGLLRDFFPKGESLLKVTGDQIRKAVDNLNDRPRKRFGYLTPNEMVELKLAARV